MEPESTPRRKGAAGLVMLGLATSLTLSGCGAVDTTGPLVAAPRVSAPVGAHQGAHPVTGQVPAQAAASSAPVRRQHHSAGARTAGDRHRPNILMITADDASVQDMQYMPHVQKLLADRGVTFTDAIAPSPVCVPARASLLTGQYAHNDRALTIHGRGGGAEWVHSRRSRNTLPVWLQRAGYDTLFVGKYLNGYGDDYKPLAQRGWTDWRAAMGGSTYSFIHTRMDYNGRRQPTTKYSTNLFTDDAARMLSERRRKTKPWYMWLNYVGPHFGGGLEPDDPQVTDPDHPEDWVKTTRPAVRDQNEFQDIQLPQTPALFAPNGPGQQTAHPASDDRMHAAVREGYQQRLEALQSVDRGVARMVAKLKATHQFKNTVIIFTSDNGYSEGDHNIFGKLWQFNQILRIPVIMAGPRVPHDKRVRTVISNPDIATTIAAIAKAKPRLRVDGVNFMPITRTGYRERVIPIEGYPVHGGLQPLYTGIRVGKWTYVDLRGHEELYNLRVDRWELSNLARLKKFHGDLVWLRRLNRRYHDCAGATCMRTYLTRARMAAKRREVVAAVAKADEAAQPAPTTTPTATPGARHAPRHDRAARRLAGVARVAARH